MPETGLRGPLVPDDSAQREGHLTWSWDRPITAGEGAGIRDGARRTEERGPGSMGEMGSLVAGGR